MGRPEPQEMLDSFKDLGERIGNLDLSDLRERWKDFADDLNFDLGGGFGNITDMGETWFNDPFVNGGDDEDAGPPNTWSNNGEGLSLQMLNALDATWQQEYAAALLDWENGNPDVLTLPTKDVTPESECTQKEGVMKVCNGNYGETGWLGINELMSTTIGKTIVSSVAKMNEYYLFTADIYERQYTMCHEVGHGFGLDHTDENFYNRDLGNCLDYTKVPKNNLHPDVTNYNRLAEMYGTPIRRNLRRRSHAASTNVQVPSIPPQVHLEYKNAIAEFYQQHQHHRHQPTPAANSNSSTVEPQQQWRLLESHARGKKYRRLLGDTGFELEVHMLLAHPPE